MPKEKITRATLDRYLEHSTLDDAQKKALEEEFTKTGGDRRVLNKAVQLNGRKSMTKVPKVSHIK